MTASVFLLPSHTEVQASLRAVKLLEQLLRRTWDRPLPPLDWRVTFTGTLVGEIYPHDPDTARRIFDAWVDELAITSRHEHTCDGVTYLRASGTVNRVNVTIEAAIHDDAPED